MSKDIVRVLLVEDSPSDARLLCAALEDYPLQRFEIERAERLSEALAFLGQKSCDVILLDLNLPDSSGLETCAHISRAAGPVPIIILTGAEDEAIAAEAMRLGVQDYLVKGQAYGSMIGRTIRYTVERSQTQEALREANQRLQEQAEEVQSQAEKLRTANEELRESEARHRRLLENLKGSHFVYVHDTRGVFQYLSESVTDVLGYSPEEFQAHYSTYMTDHPANQAVYRLTELSIQGIRQPPYEVNVWHKDGSARWLEVQEVPVLDAQGQVSAVEGVAQDITGRKETENALRQRERQFRSTFENAAIGIAHVALDGHILLTNSRFCEIAGSSCADVVGRTCEEITFADDWKTEKDQLQRLLAGAVPHYSIEKRYLRKDGHPVWVNLTRSIQRGETGQAEYFIVLVEDISERKWMEAALRESEQWFRTLANAMPQLVWTADPDGRVDYYNDRYEEFRGIAPTSDGDFQWAPVVHKEDRALTMAAWEHAVRTGETYQIEHRVQRTDGSYHWYLSRGAPVRDREGRIVKWFGTATDIDNVKRAEEALRESNTTLESKVMQRTAELKHRTRQLQKLTLEMSKAEDRERERLAHILHDDLQQELAAAKFHLSMVRNQVRQDSSLHDLTTRIDEMLKDAIAKSRSLSHELSPAVLHQDHLAEIFQWLADEMQAKHGLTVHVHGQARCLSEPIRGFLYRTAQELLFNAVKHAQVREARVRVRPWGGYLGLAVSDRGRGFDPDRLRETAGFGLLSIRERIELIGGRMKIRSAPGQGSTFVVVVPNGTEALDTVGEGSPRAYPTSATSGGRGGPPLRVLLADDHQVVRQGLASLFREEETIEVVGEATNGREAVDLADQLRPDVVIMDVSMPVLGGEEATRQIKKDLPQTRIVSLSMWDEPEVRERMYQAGAESYVLKTAPAEELLAAIRGKAPCP